MESDDVTLEVSCPIMISIVWMATSSVGGGAGGETRCTCARTLRHFTSFGRHVHWAFQVSERESARGVYDNQQVFRFQGLGVCLGIR